MSIWKCFSEKIETRDAIRKVLPDSSDRVKSRGNWMRRARRGVAGTYCCSVELLPSLLAKPLTMAWFLTYQTPPTWQDGRIRWCGGRCCPISMRYGIHPLEPQSGARFMIPSGTASTASSMAGTTRALRPLHGCAGALAARVFTRFAGRNAHSGTNGLQTHRWSKPDSNS